MLLSVIVSLIVLGALAMVGVVAYLIDKSTE